MTGTDSEVASSFLGQKTRRNPGSAAHISQSEAPRRVHTLSLCVRLLGEHVSVCLMGYWCIIGVCCVPWTVLPSLLAWLWISASRVAFGEGGRAGLGGCFWASVCFRGTGHFPLCAFFCACLCALEEKSVRGGGCLLGNDLLPVRLTGSCQPSWEANNYTAAAALSLPVAFPQSLLPLHLLLWFGGLGKGGDAGTHLTAERSARRP